jgi:sulfur transfer protein SufE
MTNAELIARVRELERLRYGAVDERAQYYAANLPAETCDLATQLADALEQVTRDLATAENVTHRTNTVLSLERQARQLREDELKAELEQVTTALHDCLIEKDKIWDEAKRYKEERDRAREIMAYGSVVGLSR